MTNSRFQDNRRDINIRDGIGHAILDNVFEGKPPSEQEGLKAIRGAPLAGRKNTRSGRYWRPFMLCCVNTTKKEGMTPRVKSFARQTLIASTALTST